MHRWTPRFWASSCLTGGLLLAAFAACGEKSDPGIQIGPSGQNAGGQSGSGPSPVGGLGATGGSGVDLGGATVGGQTSDCRGLQCQQTTCTQGACTQMACAAGTSTTVTGTVYDPAGKVPLYNAVVYVPNGEVPTITTGASCDRCDASVTNPVVAALTDTRGKFVLQDVPVGTEIPLVIQIGKWRRRTTIANVPACAETALTDVNQTRLPRNKSEGDIPRIAITTGGADSMECLPRRMGIDDAEFTNGTGDGRIHLYRGSNNGRNTIATSRFSDTLNGGAELSPAPAFWGSLESLRAYDIVILSCEGATIEQQKPEAAREAMYQYASAGGRVFASHWHHIWFSEGPDPVPSVGMWSDREDPPEMITPGTINTGFTKGQAFAEWLVNVGASSMLGQIPIEVARDNIQSINPMLATEWISIQNTHEDAVASPRAVELLSFNTPLDVPSEMQCGRVVFNDLHVSATGEGDLGDQPGNPFPESCEVRDLTAQEKAVEFMLFDLSSCIQDDEDPPRPPQPPPR